jgi:hypothetical protein
LIVRELRLRPYTDVVSVSTPSPAVAPTVARPRATKDSESLMRLAARHSRRRVVDDREL